MQRIILVLIFVLGATLSAFAQQTPPTTIGTSGQDVVFLKNGWELHGIILAPDSMGRIRIRIAGGSVFAFPADEIVKIERSEAQPSTGNPGSGTVDNSAYLAWLNAPRIKPTAKKLYGTFEITLRPMAKMSMGWRLQEDLEVGGGVGLSLQLSPNLIDEVPALMPIFAEGRWRFGETVRNAGFLYAAAGYTQPLFRSQMAQGLIESSLAKGREYAEAAIGMQFFTRTRVSYLLSLGWKHQRLAQDVIIWTDWPDFIVAKQINTVSRLSLSCGLTF